VVRSIPPIQFCRARRSTPCLCPALSLHVQPARLRHSSSRTFIRIKLETEYRQSTSAPRLQAANFSAEPACSVGRFPAGHQARTRAGMMVAVLRPVRILVTMQTWVLVITLVVNSQAVGITSIPGYTSEGACHSAGVVAQNSEKIDGRAIQFFCLVGPGK
jgi:hypothetical protein